jgi:hypothetical protein
MITPAMSDFAEPWIIASKCRAEPPHPYKGVVVRQQLARLAVPVPYLRFGSTAMKGRIIRSMARSSRNGAALADAGIDAQSIDLILLATSTPDDTFPATAVRFSTSLASATAQRC